MSVAAIDSVFLVVVDEVVVVEVFVVKVVEVDEVETSESSEVVDGMVGMGVGMGVGASVGGNMARAITASQAHPRVLAQPRQSIAAGTPTSPEHLLRKFATAQKRE